MELLVSIIDLPLYTLIYLFFAHFAQGVKCDMMSVKKVIKISQREFNCYLCKKMISQKCLLVLHAQKFNSANKYLRFQY